MMEISGTAKTELSWRENNIKNSIHYIKGSTFAMTIYTDASTSGWGAFNGDRQIYGFWTLEER